MPSERPTVSTALRELPDGPVPYEDTATKRTGDEDDADSENCPPMSERDAEILAMCILADVAGGWTEYESPEAMFKAMGIDDESMARATGQERADDADGLPE